jgi:hypothetical protein
VWNSPSFTCSSETCWVSTHEEHCLAHCRTQVGLSSRLPWRGILCWKKKGKKQMIEILKIWWIDSEWCRNSEEGEVFYHKRIERSFWNCPGTVDQEDYSNPQEEQVSVKATCMSGVLWRVVESSWEPKTHNRYSGGWNEIKTNSKLSPSEQKS